MSIPSWYVITGGPSSGKTTIINHLSKLGYHTIPEAARILIETELEKGKSLEEIRINEIEFQRKVLKMKLELEGKAPKEETVFVDRGIPDSIAYYQVHGENIEEVMESCQEKRYKKIFFLEQVEFEKDHVRIEDKKLADLLSKNLYEAYSELGYEIINIPQKPVEERIKTILTHTK